MATHRRQQAVEAGREALQNRADVEMGLKNLSDHYAELGAGFGEEIDRRAADAKLILDTALKYSVPVDINGQNGWSTSSFGFSFRAHGVDTGTGA